jgi:hypothetical protein
MPLILVIQEVENGRIPVQDQLRQKKFAGHSGKYLSFQLPKKYK